jgi:membrane-associated PAP2 superfamily phosphatase
MSDFERGPLAMPASPARDALVLLGLLVPLLAWDLSGADLWLSAWMGGQEGFPLRQAGTWATTLHEVGRWLSALALGALLLDAAWPRPPWRRHDAAPALHRRWIALATVATLLAVPALKRFSTTSCPWDVADFGGSVPWVPHWLLTLTDGGPGHCFPSGHAVAAFAFLVPALAWRRQGHERGTAALWVVLTLGTLFGGVQLLRGAHYLSHVLWSAWLCAALAVAASALPGAALGRSGMGATDTSGASPAGSGPDRPPF